MSEKEPERGRSSITAWEVAGTIVPGAALIAGLAFYGRSRAEVPPIAPTPTVDAKILTPNPTPTSSPTPTPPNQ